jgi:transcription antitermination factor NusG
MIPENLPIIPKKHEINWHVLYTTPRAEKRVYEKIQGENIECYLPLHRSPRVWSDRVKLVDVPLISSYVFVRCKEYETMNLLRLNGVVRVVFYNGKPAVIRQFEIDAMKEFLKLAEGKELTTGEEVEILSGSLKKQSGKIIKIKKKFIFLRIEQLAATICVNIENVAPLKRLK